jgi:MipA family protein
MKLPAPSLVLFTLALAVATSGAHAQSCDPVLLMGPPPAEGTGHVGAAVLSGGDCYGTGASRTDLVPVLNYRWNNGFFAGTTYGLGYVFPSPEYLQYGLRLTADMGRKAKHSPVLAGMSDVDAAVEAGGFLNVFFSKQVFLTSTLRYGSGNDRRGLRFDLRAFYVNQFASQWRFGAALATTAANSQYMQSYFGVTNAEAIPTVREAYTPGAGLRDVRAIVSLTHFITPTWDAVVSVTSTALQGDAKRSTIVRDRNPVNGMVALTHDF